MSILNYFKKQPAVPPPVVTSTNHYEWPTSKPTHHQSSNQTPCVSSMNNTHSPITTTNTPKETYSKPASTPDCILKNTQQLSNAMSNKTSKSIVYAHQHGYELHDKTLTPLVAKTHPKSSSQHILPTSTSPLKHVKSNLQNNNTTSSSKLVTDAKKLHPKNTHQSEARINSHPTNTIAKQEPQQQKVKEQNLNDKQQKPSSVEKKLTHNKKKRDARCNFVLDSVRVSHRISESDDDDDIIVASDDEVSEEQEHNHSHRKAKIAPDMSDHEASFSDVVSTDNDSDSPESYNEDDDDDVIDLANLTDMYDSDEEEDDYSSEQSDDDNDDEDDGDDASDDDHVMMDRQHHTFNAKRKSLHTKHKTKPLSSEAYHRLKQPKLDIYFTSPPDQQQDDPQTGNMDHSSIHPNAPSLHSNYYESFNQTFHDRHHQFAMMASRTKLSHAKPHPSSLTSMQGVRNSNQSDKIGYIDDDDDDIINDDVDHHHHHRQSTTLPQKTQHAVSPASTIHQSHSSNDQITAKPHHGHKFKRLVKPGMQPTHRLKRKSVITEDEDDDGLILLDTTDTCPMSEEKNKVSSSSSPRHSYIPLPSTTHFDQDASTHHQSIIADDQDDVVMQNSSPITNSRKKRKRDQDIDDVYTVYSDDHSSAPSQADKPPKKKNKKSTPTAENKDSLMTVDPSPLLAYMIVIDPTKEKPEMIESSQMTYTLETPTSACINYLAQIHIKELIKSQVKHYAALAGLKDGSSKKSNANKSDAMMDVMDENGKKQARNAKRECAYRLDIEIQNQDDQCVVAIANISLYTGKVGTLRRPPAKLQVSSIKPPL